MVLFTVFNNDRSDSINVWLTLTFPESYSVGKVELLGPNVCTGSCSPGSTVVQVEAAGGVVIRICGIVTGWCHCHILSGKNEKISKYREYFYQNYIANFQTYFPGRNSDTEVFGLHCMGAEGIVLRLVEIGLLPSQLSLTELRVWVEGSIRKCFLICPSI